MYVLFLYSTFFFFFKDCISLIMTLVTRIMKILWQGSPTLLLESYRPADFSSNPCFNTAAVIIK